MILPAGSERLPLARLRDFAHETDGRGELVIEPSATKLDAVVAFQFDVETGERRVPDAHPRFTLILEMPEEVQPVAQDRPAGRERDLLVIDRHHTVEHRVLGVESARAEVAAYRTGEGVGARTRDGAHLHARRTAQRGVEPVGDVLEFRDCVLAVARLPPEPALGGDLLPVEGQLELALFADVAIRNGR